jgi:hypothetical protein
VDLAGDEALGFDDAACIVASALELGRWDYEACQPCVVRYSAVEFEAATITALIVAVSAGRQPGEELTSLRRHRFVPTETAIAMFRGAPRRITGTSDLTGVRDPR